MSHAVDDVSFLYLKNRSRLPGKLPFSDVQTAKKTRKIFCLLKCVEGFLFGATAVGFLITFAIAFLRAKVFFGIPLWKLEMFIMMTTGSRLLTTVLVKVIVCLLHKIFRSRNRFLYVIHNVQNNVIWSAMSWLIVTAWQIVFARLEIQFEIKVLQALDKLFFSLAIILSLWVIKSIFVMSLASWFHMRTYHEKIVESLFFAYVFEAMSGLPLVEFRSYLPAEANLGFSVLQRLNPHELTAWQAKKMMVNNNHCLASSIKTEAEARSEAERIFRNVAKPSTSFIELDDLKRFLLPGDALNALSLFRRTYDDSESIKISLFALQEWMVHSFKRHRCLLLSLKDTDAASRTVGTWFNIIFLVVLATFSVMLLGLGGNKYLVVLSTNSLVFTYLFGLLWKDLFFSMCLLYIRHPFDVGDEVEFEKIEMFVEKLKLMETDFVGKDRKKYTISNTGLCDTLLINNSRSELPAWKIEDIV